MRVIDLYRSEYNYKVWQANYHSIQLINNAPTKIGHPIRVSQMDHGPILVIVELNKDHQPAAATMECMTVGRKIADDWGVSLNALVLGSKLNGVAEAMRYYGFDSIYTADHEAYKHFNGELYSEVARKVYEQTLPEVIIAGDTLNSVDLMPRLACALNGTAIMSCLRIESKSDELICTKAVYSSNVIAHYCMTVKPFIVSMASGSCNKARPGMEHKGEHIVLDIVIDESKLKTKVIERIADDGEQVNLSAADIIVAGGRGIGCKEGFEEIKELANFLGAIVGASRPPCDLGWITPKAQVGQTGAVVSPTLYIAIGISGTMQHLAGMSASKKIVAINKDPQANIFKVSDYGIVGRYEDIVPALRRAMKESTQ